MSLQRLRSLALLLVLSLLLAGCASDASGEEGDETFDEDVGADSGTDLPDASELAEDASPMRRAVSYLETATTYRMLLRESKGGEARYTEREAYRDDDRNVRYFRIMTSTPEGKPRSDEYAGRIGATSFQCQDEGECRFTAGGAEDNDVLATALLSTEPAYMLIPAGLQLLALQTPPPTDDTVDGVAAWKLTFNGAGDAPDSVVWVQKSPARFLRSQVALDMGSGGITFANATFTYDDAPPVGLTRAETLTLTDAADAREYGQVQAGYEDGLAHWNFTLPEVTTAPLVPLSDVTVTVLDRYDDGVTMSLENKTASTPKLQVTFEDTDADGLVSPGDVLRVHVRSAGSNTYNPLGVEDFDVTMVDEKGWKVVPGNGY